MLEDQEVAKLTHNSEDTVRVFLAAPTHDPKLNLPGFSDDPKDMMPILKSNFNALRNNPNVIYG